MIKACVDTCPGDNFVLESAILGKVKYLVTGDKKHLLPLKTVKSVKIVDAAFFIQHLKYQ